MKQMKIIRLVPIALALSVVLFLCGYLHQNISLADDDQVNFAASKLSDCVDFENDLIPIFTKFGCNAGACHGAAAGRGEFKLSLFGGNPQADYEAIVRQLTGRRINLMHPEVSLVILKPTAQTSHGGGHVLDENGEGVQLLRAWIQQGAHSMKHCVIWSVLKYPRKNMSSLILRVRFNCTQLPIFQMGQEKT